VYGEPLGLIDDQEMLVLIHNIQGPILSDEREGPWRWELNLYRGSGMKEVAGA